MSWNGHDSLPGNGTNENDVGVAFDFSKKIAYAEFGFGLISRSTDFGRTWSSPPNSFPGGDAPHIAVDNSNGLNKGTVYISSSTNFVYSQDSGRSWSGTFAGATLSDKGIIAVSGYNGHVYLATSGGLGMRLYHSAGGSGSGQQDTTFHCGGNIQRKILSMAAAPSSGRVIGAYEADGNTSGRASTIGVFWKDKTTDVWHIDTTVFSDYNNLAMPIVAVDDQDHWYVAFWKGSDLILATSIDQGSSWRQIKINDTNSSAEPSHSGLGDYFGMAPIDSTHVGIAWCDNRYTYYRLYFANVSLGTQFRNEFNGIYRDSLIYYGQSDTTHIKVASKAIRILDISQKYIVSPKAQTYHDVSLPDTTYGFYHWNNSSADSNNHFAHQFWPTLTGSLQSEEANFKSSDSITIRNDMEGGDGGRLLVANDGGVSGIYDTVNSIYRYGGALHPPVTYGLKSYNVYDTSQHFFRTYWWFEKWQRPDTSTLLTFNSISILSHRGRDTSFSAFFKGHLRSADTLNALDFNNGRKSCYSQPDQRHFIVYESRGNIYFDSSVSNTFCDFVKERKLNKVYGNAFHPAIAFLDRPDEDSLHNPVKTIFVVWEELLATDSVKHYRVMLCCRDSVGIWHDPVGVDSFTMALTNIDPPAPSVCSAQTKDGITISNVIHGAVAWHRDSTVWVAAITNSNGVGLKRIIDSTFHGSYVTIEPGYWGTDHGALGAAHNVDFHLSWQDTTNSNHGKDGGLRYRYLIYGAAIPGNWSTPYATDMIMSNYWKVAPSDRWGMPQHPSICIAKDNGHPIIVSYILDEKSTYLSMPYSSDTTLPHRRSGMYARIKDSVNGSWGLFRIIAKYYYDSLPVLFAPSVTCYPDVPAKYSASWWKRQWLSSTNTKETIQHGTWAFTDPTVGASGRDYYTPDSTVFSIDTARTPHMEYCQKFSSADSSILCSHPYHYPDTLLPRVIRRANVNCEISDNRVMNPIKSWDELTASSGNSFVRLAIGEFKLIDSTGTSTEIPLMKEMMLKPAATPSDIQNVNGSVYFKLPTTANKFIYFHAPSVGDTSDLGEFNGTKSIRFTTEFVDSSTGIPVMSLGMQRFMTGTAMTTCGFDTMSVGALAGLGKTLFVRTRMDTGSGFSNLRLQASRVNSEDKLSAVLAHGSGLGKQAMHYFGRAGLVPEEVNPIDLTVFPNPFNPKTQVAFTVPLEDAEDLAEVKIFDMQAKDVSTLVHEIRPAGRYTATFDATNLPSGRYIVAVHLRNHMQSKLMVLTR